jgi:vesicle coat complex subunit
MSLIARLTHPNPETREDALIVLSVKERPSDEELRALADRLHDDSRRIREAAAQALHDGAMFLWGFERVTSALPAGSLLPALADRSAKVRENVLRVLSHCAADERIRSAAEALLGDPALLVRVSAAAVLWAQARDLAGTLPAVEAALRSGERQAVIYACHLLVGLGQAAGEVVPLLWGHLRHPDGVVRGNAAYALLKCCADKRLLAEAAALVLADAGDAASDALVRFAAHKLRKAAGAEPAAPAGPPRE